MPIKIIKSVGDRAQFNNPLDLEQLDMVVTVKAGTIVWKGTSYALTEDNVATITTMTKDGYVYGYLVQKKDDQSISVLVDEFTAGDPGYDFGHSPYLCMYVLYFIHMPNGVTSLDQVEIQSYQTMADGE